MSLIKKIKQFINGSWQEFNIHSEGLSNVVNQNSDQDIYGVKYFLGETETSVFSGPKLGTTLKGDAIYCSSVDIAGGETGGMFSRLSYDSFSISDNDSGEEVRYGFDSIRQGRNTYNFPEEAGTFATQEWVTAESSHTGAFTINNSDGALGHLTISADNGDLTYEAHNMSSHGIIKLNLASADVGNYTTTFNLPNVSSTREDTTYTLATQEWVQAQGYGSGSSDAAPAVYSPKETTIGSNTFTFDKNIFKHGRVYKFMIIGGSNQYAYDNHDFLTSLMDSVDVYIDFTRYSFLNSKYVTADVADYGPAGDAIIYTIPNCKVTVSLSYNTASSEESANSVIPNTDPTFSIASGDSNTPIYIDPKNVKLVEVR